MKLYAPIYDPKKTYYENFDEGPFGDFGDGKVIENIGEPQYKFLGRPVHAPFGIAAGPLPNARFVKAAWDKGFDIVTCKSVRTGEYPCHPLPNILPVENETIGEKEMQDGVIVAGAYDEKLSIANSMGVPSVDPLLWKQEIKKTLALKKEGQLLIAAFNGTDRHQGFDAFLRDHIEGIGMLCSIGVDILEINLSCPNEGSKSLLCFDISNTKKILEEVKKIRGDRPLLVKIAYFKDKALLEDFVKNIGPLVDGIVAINTLGIPVKTADGGQAFPGEGRGTAGVSGAPIKWAGLEMVRELAELRKKFGYSFTIVGVGGVLSSQDYGDYRKSGADAVLSVAGAMWNPYLAKEIKEYLRKK